MLDDEARVQSEFRDKTIELWYSYEGRDIQVHHKSNRGPYTVLTEPIETYSVQKVIHRLTDALRLTGDLQKDYYRGKRQYEYFDGSKTRDMARDLQKGMTQIQQGRILLGTG